MDVLRDTSQQDRWMHVDWPTRGGRSRETDGLWLAKAQPSLSSNQSDERRWWPLH